MRAFSKDLPPITYLSDCLLIYSCIWNEILRKDLNLQVFLEYEEELGVRGKNVKEKISEFFGIVQVWWTTIHVMISFTFQKSSGELLLASTQHDGDAYFEAEKVIKIKFWSPTKYEEQSWPLIDFEILGFWCLCFQVRLVELHSKLRTSCIMADKMSSTHKVWAVFKMQGPKVFWCTLHRPWPIPVPMWQPGLQASYLKVQTWVHLIWFAFIVIQPKSQQM